MKLLRELLFPVIAVLVAFVVGGVIVWVIGDNPFEVYGLLLGSALTWPDGIGYTLFYATPLIFTGLAVAVAFRCGLLNIGAEGQLYVAAFACAWVSMNFLRGGTLLPISVVNVSSRCSRFSALTRNSVRVAGFMVVSHNCCADISPRPL